MTFPSCMIILRFFILYHYLHAGLDDSIMELLSLPMKIMSSSVFPAMQVSSSNSCICSTGMQIADIATKVQASCIRRMQLKNDANQCSKEVYVLESPGSLGIGGKVWDSSFVLMKYLALHQSEYVRQKHILELGCGTGITGMVFSHSFGH
jgi:hypothetical protein